MEDERGDRRGGEMRHLVGGTWRPIDTDDDVEYVVDPMKANERKTFVVAPKTTSEDELDAIARSPRRVRNLGYTIRSRRRRDTSCTET